MTQSNHVTYEIGTLLLTCISWMISENCWNVNLTQVFLSSHITRSVRCWSLFKAHESLLVYQFLAFVKLGPFHISEKGFYLDKFHVIINILQVQLDCCDLTNFGRSGQIFKRTAVVPFKNCTPYRNMPPAAGNGYSLRRHNTFLTYVPS